MLLCSAAALTGCATQVPQVLTPRILPRAFSSQSAEPSPVWPRADWWEGFGSPELSEFVQAAQEDNRNLAAAAGQVMAARAQTFIARSALFPQFDLQAQAGRGSSFFIGCNGGSTCNRFTPGIGASYEVDFWGLARANLRSAQEALKSTRFAQQTLALSITANVANGYFNVLALRAQIAIAREDIVAINSILDVIKLRVATGTSSDLDLARERAQAEFEEA